MSETHPENLMAARLISWNVNGMRSVLKKGFIEWLASSGADVVCVQESRALPEDIAPECLKPKGYTSIWNPAEKKGYSGVAAYVKKEPLSVGVLGKKEFDGEGRVQTLEYKDYTIVNTYFPNSQPERRRLDYKLAFCSAVLRLCNRLVKSGTNVVLCGDYNIAHTEIDLARPKQNEDNPGYLPEEREAMTRFLKAGYVDTFRHFCPDSDHYTWWSYRGGARAKNVGWRLDYHCVNKDFIGRVKRAEILSEVLGSDHCPVAITLR